MAEIRLTPTGVLRWEAGEGQTEPTKLSALREVFSVNWRDCQLQRLHVERWEGGIEYCFPLAENRRF